MRESVKPDRHAKGAREIEARGQHEVIFKPELLVVDDEPIRPALGLPLPVQDVAGEAVA